MKVTCELTDYSNPAKPSVRIHNCFRQDANVEIETNGERYVVNADELIRAIRKCSNASPWNEF